MEPTKKKVSAINYFHTVAGFHPPCEHPFVQKVIQGIKNRLGSRGIPRAPISLAEIYEARTRALAAREVDLAYIADVCTIMQEAELRWDDIADVRLGDIVWGTTAIRILVVDSKTDKKKQGQFGTLAHSTSADSASHKLRQLIHKRIASFASRSKSTQARLLSDLQRKLPSLPYSSPTLSAVSTLPQDIRELATKTNLPLENLPLLSTWPWTSQPTSLLDRLSYKCFLRHLKNLFRHQRNIGTHSLRRGGVTEKMDQGIEARLVQWLGRWSTTEAFEGYVGSRANISAASAAIERARQLDSGAGAARCAHAITQPRCGALSYSGKPYTNRPI